MSNDLETFLSLLPQHAQDYLTGRKLDEVECVIADLPGIARGKAVPAAKYARQGSFHLPDSIFYQTITGDWGEAAQVLQQAPRSQNKLGCSDSISRLIND